MSAADQYKAFVGRYLARGAAGVAVGLAVVTAPASSEATSTEDTGARSFADRLSIVRSAVSEHIKESEMLLAQGVLPPPVRTTPPPPPVRSFENFGKAAFQDSWKNFDNSFANVPRK